MCRSDEGVAGRRWQHAFSSIPHYAVEQNGMCIAFLVDRHHLFMPACTSQEMSSVQRARSADGCTSVSGKECLRRHLPSPCIRAAKPTRHWHQATSVHTRQAARLRTLGWPWPGPALWRRVRARAAVVYMGARQGQSGIRAPTFAGTVGPLSWCWETTYHLKCVFGFIRACRLSSMRQCDATVRCESGFALDYFVTQFGRCKERVVERVASVEHRPRTHLTCHPYPPRLQGELLRASWVSVARSRGRPVWMVPTVWLLF